MRQANVRESRPEILGSVNAARAAVLRFLEARKRYIKKHGAASAEALVPVWWKGELTYYSSTTFRTIKAEIEAIALKNGAPVRFHLKTLRDTYVQQNIDRNPANLSAVSITAGHATTRTTETSYGRIRVNQAIEDLQKAWELDAPPNIQSHELKKSSTLLAINEAHSGACDISPALPYPLANGTVFLEPHRHSFSFCAIQIAD